MAEMEDVVNQAIADFDDIERAIEEQGVDVPVGTDTKEYGRLIRSIRTGGDVDQEYNPESENAQSGKAVAGALATQPIKYLESLDKENYLNLYDLESGMYVLYGYFLVYPNATKRFVFSKKLFVAVSHGTISTCIQVFYPPYNTVQYLNIYPPDEEAGTDYTYERKDAELYYMESVENKVTEIDENSDDTHYPSAKAVYNKVKDTSNSLKGTASGEVIRVDDVNPIKHTVKAKVKSKNLVNLGNVVRKVNATVSYTEPQLTIIRTNQVESWANVYIGIGNYADYVGKTLTLSVENLNTYVWTVLFVALDETNALLDEVVGKASSFGKMTFTATIPTNNNAKLLAVRIVSGNNSVADGEECVLQNLQVEEGDTATEYEPYVDPSTVTVTRCGKNLLDVTKAEMMIVGSSGAERYGILFDSTGTFTFSGKATSGVACKVITDGEYGDYVTLLNGFDYVFELSENQQMLIYQGVEGMQLDYGLTNAQIEVGGVATNYEAYNGSTYTPSADGTVNGITSLSPTMTLLTDKAGVTIEAEYHQDINAAFDKINAILETLLNGGA